VAVVGGPGASQQPAGRRHRRPGLGQGRERLLDYRLDEVGSSELSANDASRVAGGNFTRRLPQVRT